MVNRVIFTLISGFALVAGTASMGQGYSPPSSSSAGSSVVAEQPSSPSAANADAQSSVNVSDTSAATRWWQRLAPSATPSKQPAGGAATTNAPAPQPLASAAGTTSYFGKLLGNNKKPAQTDPFAVKTVAYEEPNTKSAIVVADSADPKKSELTPPAVPNPWAAPASDPSATGSAAKCPYPDTGIQNSYEPMQSPSATIVSDNPTSSAEAPTTGKVHGAFDGLLGHDDVRTKKEAASAPLLSPYNKLPVDKPQDTANARYAKQESSTSRYGRNTSTEPEKSAPASTDAPSNVITDKPKSDATESVVNAAFTVPPADVENKTANVQVAATAAVVTDAPTQTATPQPLQLNGVEPQQLTGNPLNRPKFIYRPAATVMDTAGHKLIKPEVRVAPDSVESDPSKPVQLAAYAANTEEMLPPQNMAPENAYPIDEQQWMPQMSGFESGACDNCQGNCNGNNRGWMHGQDDGCCRSGGIGIEHVQQAPFFIQTTQPFNNCRVRLDLAENLNFPDRSEYFWAQTTSTGRGPGNDRDGETKVNYQDLDFYIEKGTKRLSIGTDLPIRAVDPEVRDNTTGFADMSVRTKAVLMDGKNWQLTQLFNTYLPTGSVHHGTGDGHVSLEPGVAYRWRWSDWTYFHGDLKYLFPIAADPDFAGQIFNYGFGWSHVAIETDTWALIPTLEFECWTFVDGRQTIPGTIAPLDPILASEEINTIGVMNICPGLRWVCDKGCDCGTKEFGICAGISVTDDHLYEKILRMELRWSR